VGAANAQYCKRDGDGFTLASMNANSRETLPGKNLYEMWRDGDPIPYCGEPGQTESFQGAPLMTTNSNKGSNARRLGEQRRLPGNGGGNGNKATTTTTTTNSGAANQDPCVRVNICHGNAGFGWNRITVDRSSIGEDSTGSGQADKGHASFNHNDPSNNKREDYYPGTSVANPNGAGKNGYLDSECNFVCAADDTTCTGGKPNEPVTEPDGTVVVPTTAPEEVFPPGTTVTDGNGDECVLQTDCSCPVSKSADVPSGTKGDPHFIMWNGKHFDFHGGCDLVLVDAPEFNNGQGLKIHVRTKIETWYSYVQRVAVQIGDDVFEVQGGFTTRRFFHNGHALPTRKLTKTNGPLPITVGGNEVRYITQKDHVSWKVSIHLPDGQFVSLRTIKNWMRVDIENPLPEYFGSATGLMGSFKEDLMLGRDGATVIEDPIEFGQEWQVRGDSLFNEADGPQYPQTCEMPAVERSTKRLLAESDLTYDMAEKACAHLKNEQERDDCIYDVIASSDTEIAGAY
jgi:hypothetical protein